MALGFNNTNGEAKKSNVTYMKLADGDNTFRLLPNSLQASYTYWVKGQNGKDLPFEALEFSREDEKFDNSVPSPVREAGILNHEGKPLNCQWSYKCLVINQATNQVEVLQLKKGILQTIISVARDMEIDPSDVDTGTWFTVERKKTGPKAFNVEYNVRQLKCKSEPLSDEFKQMAADSKTIDEMLPRESYADQAKRLDRHLNGNPDDNAGGSDNTDNEAISELD